MASVSLQALLSSAASSLPATMVFDAITAFPNEAQTVTFTAVSIGSASSDRYVFVVIPYYNGGASNISISAVVIGGVSATIHSQPFQTSVTRGGCAIASALVPTGTTATITITWAASGAGFYRPHLAVYRVTGLLSNVPVDVVTNGATSGISQVMTTNVTAGGFVLLGSNIRDTAKTMSGLTTDYNLSPVANYQYIGGSSLVSASGTMAATISGGVTAFWCVVMASFR